MDAQQIIDKVALDTAEAIRSLPEVQRTVKQLMDNDALSIVEVADKLSITMDTVRVTKANADRAVDIFLEKKYDNQE